MLLSNRLEAVFNMIDKSKCLADIGTDHGYIPIKAILEEKCERAIASDIKKGPIDVALKNIKRYGLLDKIDLRIGPGLTTLKEEEAETIVIAGMGGNLIADIIKNDIDVAKNSNYLILQPVQYPEVLRQELYNENFYIIDEDIIKDENKYYHILKVTYGKKNKYNLQAEFFVGPVNTMKKSKETLNYIDDKIIHFEKILMGLDINLHYNKYKEVENLINSFKELKKCL
ncbi:tRNA (adenine(22)-N(1))-methyltransferase [Caloramator proteoclasticus]|uniref:tRNA (Adenine22-N1)-methyltransferase n=1 Tax=Caloramator proteoclasticus DSM 10124 TaxID=1121262 RepID=A0A1M4WWJ6_9CLOT|nr:tRNA (adenine(22)-N(1))-methyltransferase TrmK [Caloramator proteoclasticus]SHE85352.1 tRNA (adenine22-N1)-methyltransferase [Caloramator proteoclasticus DSM 10124]